MRPDAVKPSRPWWHGLLSGDRDERGLVCDAQRGLTDLGAVT